MAVLCVPLLIVSLDTTVLNVALPTSVAPLMFALIGVIFVLTQWLQFELGYSALRAGVRMLPAAGGIVLFAPLSPVFVRRLGTKLTVALGLAIAAGGVWQIAGVSFTSTYAVQLPGAFMLGIGTGMVMPACTGSLMGALYGGTECDAPVTLR